MPKNYWRSLQGVKVSQSSERIRSFIAIELSEEARKGLARLENELVRNEQPFIKWVRPESIHLTLKFLGNISVRRVEEISSAIKMAVQGVPPFHLEISGLGAFPNLRQPRVLWVGIHGETDMLLRLQQNVDSQLASLSFAKEERPFVPHLTLARLRQEASPEKRRGFGKLVESVSSKASYAINVNTLCLMRSQLRPEGAIYTRLFQVKLTA